MIGPDRIAPTRLAFMNSPVDIPAPGIRSWKRVSPIPEIAAKPSAFGICSTSSSTGSVTSISPA